MNEVKLTTLEELVPTGGTYWSSDPRIYREDQGKRIRSAKVGRAGVEQGLADLLNEGWQIEGVSGDYMSHGFIVLVRDR